MLATKNEDNLNVDDKVSLVFRRGIDRVVQNLRCPTYTIRAGKKKNPSN